MSQLTATHTEVLNTLRKHGPLSPLEIGAWLDLDTDDTIKALAGLFIAGLVSYTDAYDTTDTSNDFLWWPL
jgi:hypothetical protein